MTKTDLQKELLEKVKPGTKPSDIKRQNIKPKSNKDEGYSSDEENIPKAPPLPAQQIKELQKQANYWSQTAQNHLKNLQLAQAKITNLEEQLKRKPKIIPVKSESEQLLEKNKQIEIIAKENEKNIEKIKELEAKIKEQDKTIQELKNQDKNPVKSQGDPIETFNCYHCKKHQELSLLVLELPEGKLCQPCWTILRKKTKEKTNPTPQLFICVVCEEEKKK